LTNELLEDPKDLAANTLLHAAQQLSVNAQIFAGVYLLVHGIVKVGLVIRAVEKEAVGLPACGHRPRSLHRLAGVPLIALGVALPGIPHRGGCGHPLAPMV